MNLGCSREHDSDLTREHLWPPPITCPPVTGRTRTPPSLFANKTGIMLPLIAGRTRPPTRTISYPAPALNHGLSLDLRL